jgi:hypothetical protein
VQPLVIQGSNFVHSVTGNRYQILGVAYQPGGEGGYKPQTGEDPLSNGDVCLRDAALMQRLGMYCCAKFLPQQRLIEYTGVNAIRVVSVAAFPKRS